MWFFYVHIPQTHSMVQFILLFVCFVFSVRKTKEKQSSVNEVIEMFVTLSPLVLEGVSGVEHVSL